MAPFSEILHDLQILATEAPVDYLAPNPEHQRFVQDTAVAILEDAAARENPDAVVDALFAWNEEVPLALHLAAKLAKSRNVVANLKRPAKLSVTFAVYKEHHRLLPLEEHEAGEDFVSFIEGLDETQWNRLVDSVPGPIASRDPLHFGQFDEVSTDDLRAILQDN